MAASIVRKSGHVTSESHKGQQTVEDLGNLTVLRLIVFIGCDPKETSQTFLGTVCLHPFLFMLSWPKAKRIFHSLTVT